MGRKLKLGPDMSAKIEGLLSKGYTDKDVCALVGIASSTFYQWLAIGQAVADGGTHPQMPKSRATQGRYLEFMEAVTRGRAKANRRAVDTVRAAITGAETREEQREEYTETRISRHTGQPYEHREVRVTTKVTHHPGDWRAAIEHLKRRDPEHWSERFEYAIRLDGELRALMDRLGVRPEQIEEAIRKILEKRAAQEEG